MRQRGRPNFKSKNLVVFTGAENCAALSKPANREPAFQGSENSRREKFPAGDYPAAIRNWKLYLLAAPDASDAEQVKTLIRIWPRDSASNQQPRGVCEFCLARVECKKNFRVEFPGRGNVEQIVSAGAEQFRKLRTQVLGLAQRVRPF